MTEEKPKYAKDVVTTITGVTSEIVGQQIKKITFETTKGNVTWKPKVFKEQFINGMKCREKVEMQLSDMPNELIQFNAIINEKGQAKAKICYGLFETEVDGQMTTYRYIKSVTEFKKWKIIKEEVPEETIAD